jgi:hypothetical protein
MTDAERKYLKNITWAERYGASERTIAAIGAGHKVGVPYLELDLAKVEEVYSKLLKCDLPAKVVKPRLKELAKIIKDLNKPTL